MDQGMKALEVELRLEEITFLAQSTAEASRTLFDKVYCDYPFGVPHCSDFVRRITSERPPGLALDVAMGTGRNALFLASCGWSVTGFDISGVGVATAMDEARRRKLSISAAQLSVTDFVYGKDLWDLIVICYGPECCNNEGYMGRLQQSLRPGGMLVIEGFALDRQIGSTRIAGEVDGQQLFRACSTLDILVYEEECCTADWDSKAFRRLRFAAQRPLVNDVVRSAPDYDYPRVGRPQKRANLLQKMERQFLRQRGGAVKAVPQVAVRVDTQLLRE